MQVFITGISSGIGLALVRNLIASGHEVRGIARRRDALETLAAELNTPAFTFDCCDISDPVARAELGSTMTADNYCPDLVVLNAAVDLEDELPGLDFEQSAQILRTNVDGAFYWITLFIEPFLQRGSGQFIAVSSIFAQWPDAASVAYSASKASLSMLMRGLRSRYTDTRLQFKLLYLGPVDTPINPRFSEQEPVDSMIVASAPATAQYIADMIPRRRENYYFPLYIRIVFTFLRWLPDKLFNVLTSPFKR